MAIPAMPFFSTKLIAQSMTFDWSDACVLTLLIFCSIPLLLLGTSIVAHVLKRRRERLALQYRKGHCFRCGYDLRSGHRSCPECGDDLLNQAIEFWKKQK
jgi:hypothetical protein